MSDKTEKIIDISVLMSVYFRSNPQYLDEAIDSIWSNQTFKPSQICIVSDGPIPVCVELILEKWSNVLGERLTRVKLEKHGGLAAALNAGVAFCRYPLIARMDADDVSWPERFALQYKFMSQHPEVDVLGTQVEERSDDLGSILGHRRVPLSQKAITQFAKLRSPFNHPSVMYRKETIEKAGLYPYFYPEDYPLWCKMLMKGAVFANLSEILVTMRSGSAYKYRRGLDFLVSEIKVICFLYHIGFLSFNQFLISLSARLCYRLSPPSVKILLKSIASKIPRFGRNSSEIRN